MHTRPAAVKRVPDGTSARFGPLIQAWSRSRPTQQRLQFIQIDRLDEVVIEPSLGRAATVFVLAPTRQCNQRALQKNLWVN